jgi:hypothetical protein
VYVECFSEKEAKTCRRKWREVDLHLLVPSYAEPKSMNFMRKVMCSLQGLIRHMQGETSVYILKQNEMSDNHNEYIITLP